MARVLFIIIFAAIIVALEWYTFSGMKSIMGQGRTNKIFHLVYIGISLFSYYSIIYILVTWTGDLFQQRSEMFNFMSGFVFTVFVTKMLFVIIMLVQDSGRGLIGLFQYFRSFTDESSPLTKTFIPERRQFITTFGTVLAGIPFFSMLYGITKGKYQYTVEKLTLSFVDLPKSFDGFKLVQISDIHSGSFDNKDKVQAGIDIINTLNADLVCFTGDLVNAQKEEIDPYLDIFAKIEAKYGKFAILGNHDYYGDYDRNDISSEKEYFDDFFVRFEKMGFSLLNNSKKLITVQGESINLVGVENWGAGRWFPKKGDLSKATAEIKEGEFNILLSHDPTHWDEKVLKHTKHMHLTLSGHTHGFQFGFKMPGFQWSPAQYRYKKWMGLYEEAGKYLYINRGFGFLGFPGRVGLWPEITLIELKSDTKVG